MRKIIFFSLSFFIVVVLDQYVKLLILQGFRFESPCISIILTFNRGVAFSMFAFLEDYVKYLQIAAMIFLIILVYQYKFIRKYYLELSFIFAGGISNVFDRFIHIGVVDYVYWHCGFEFAIFNLADVMINVGIGLIIIKYLITKKALN